MFQVWHQIFPRRSNMASNQRLWYSRFASLFETLVTNKIQRVGSFGHTDKIMHLFWKYGPLLSAHTKNLINFKKSKIQDVHVLQTSVDIPTLPWHLCAFSMRCFFSEIRIPMDSNNSHEAGCNKPWHDLQLARVFWHRSFCKPIWFVYGNTTCQRFSSWTYWNQRVSVDKKNIPFHLPIESFSFVGLLFNVHLFPPKTCNIMQHKFHFQAGRGLLGLLGL